MHVTLPKDLEKFVQNQVGVGGFPDASAVVVEALREFRRISETEGELEGLPVLPDGACPADLKAMLMEAVNGLHHPMPPDYFDQLRKHLRAKPGAK